MKFLTTLTQRTKARSLRASAESPLTASALAASAVAVPDSGFDFVKNSRGASAAVAELSRCLDGALEGVEGDGGDLSDQLKLELGRLDKAASVYANSSLGGEFAQTLWKCSLQDAQLISLAWKCAAATHEQGVVAATDGVSIEVLRYIKPSMGGSMKAALVALVEDSTTLSTETSHLPVLIVAIRGSKSTVDFMVNANSKSEDIGSLFDVKDLLQPTDSPHSIQAHTGFLNCAIALIKHIDTLVASSKVQHIVFTGHSAGGAVASLLFLKYLADAKRTNSKKTFSCITFGSPPVTQPNLNPILEKHSESAQNMGINLALVNEYDLVSRIDQPYIRSLVDLYRSVFNQGPIRDDKSENSSTNSETTSMTSTIMNSAEACLSTSSTLMESSKMWWRLPEPAFWLVGEIILLKMEVVQADGDDSEAIPHSAVVAKKRKRLLRAFSVGHEEFKRLVFCRIPEHRRAEYEKRVGMLLDA